MVVVMWQPLYTASGHAHLGRLPLATQEADKFAS